MNKWQLARYFIDAKKDIDNILFISTNVMKLRNLDLRRIVNYKLTEFYINLCVVYDKSLGLDISRLKKEDEIIKSTYYQRDKNYAHKDDNYNRKEINYANLIKTMKEQLEHCLEKCSSSLPKEITIDYVSYDRDLYRFICKLDYETEETIKRITHPLYEKYSSSQGQVISVFNDTEDLKNINDNEIYGVVLDSGICEEEALQNRQDFCIKVNVLYNENLWCSLNKG